MDGLSKQRRNSYYYSQGGMEYLAHQTGGLFTRNTNDIPSGIRGAFDDQRGYYLIGFRPDAETAAGAKVVPEVNGEGVPRDPLHSLALRQFRQGADVDYYYYDIYNARLDRATRRPRLQTQVRLFRDGRPVFTGEVVPYDPGRQADMTRLAAASRITLGKELSPGEYVLQVIVTDALAKEKQQVVTQWMDFKIVG